MVTFQEILRKLSTFWEKQGCIIHQGYDLEVGAGTFNPATFLRCLGPEPYKAAYIEPSRRPTDGRYGENPVRFQHYFQYQVILKPSPTNIQDLYLQSLEEIGFDLSKHDIRFVHDDWEAPTLGAWGLGWEVWMDGMEVTQFTYFQSVGGIDLKPITGEITYGIERLATYLQGVDSTFNLQWSEDLTYGEIYHRNEVEWSRYNFEESNAAMWLKHFDDFEKEAKKLISVQLPLPAYDFVMKASHAFNMLDARGAISVSERTGYITRIRHLTESIAQAYVKSRESQQYPLMGRFASKTQVEDSVLPSIPQKWLSPTETSKGNFLLEIGVEELPASFVQIGCQNLEKNLEKFFHEHGIGYEAIKTYGTPRRLAIYVEGLSLKSKEQLIEKKGPQLSQVFDAEGQLKQAGVGFFNSLELPIPTHQQVVSGEIPGIEIQKIKENEYLFARLKKPGKATADLLKDNLPKIILGIEFPKKMRWADYDIAFARPFRWFVCLIDQDVLPFKVGNLMTSQFSAGHRQLDNRPVKIPSADKYLATLKEHFVLADIEERKANICQQLDALEQKIDAKIIERDKVIPQVLNLVEWPEVTYAEYDSAFLKIPKEVLISEMVEHQKYFPVANDKGELKNLFIITANNTPSDLIRKGNQKVISARLKDGAFLYEQDLKTSFEDFDEKLKQVTYLKNLGSIHDKVKRIEKHADALHKLLPLGEAADLKRAAYLSKMDLASSMVYEFPELQGVMGRIYALAKNEPREVALAIEEQWMPKGERAELPSTSTGTLLSLADKIDNLLSCFGSNLRPTSSSDPYALRRQVLGMIRILIQKKLKLPLKEILKACYHNFPVGSLASEEATLQDLEGFIQNRIKSVFLEYGVAKDEIEASLSSGFNDIYDTFSKVKALHDFRSSGKQFSLLFEVYKRAKGQLNGQDVSDFSEVLLKENAEKNLHSAFKGIQSDFEKALNSRNYETAYLKIAELQPKLADLFDQVKILDDNPEIRGNRLALLNKVFGLFGKLLDFSKIQEA